MEVAVIDEKSVLGVGQITPTYSMLIEAMGNCRTTRGITIHHTIDCCASHHISALGQATHEAIKGSRLVVKGGPHGLHETYFEEVNRELLDFRGQAMSRRIVTR
jgi:hypothetical protein